MISPRQLDMTVSGSLSSGAAELAEKAVWDTIWLVAQLPGMTEGYDWLLEYGRIVNRGVPTRAAALLLLWMMEGRAA